MKPVKQAKLFNALIAALGRVKPGAPTPGPSPGAAAPMAERFPLKILIADDNAINQQVAKRVLLQHGYASDFAVNGEQAIEAAELQSYDVIFMDLQMPDTDGLEATRRICEMFAPEERPYIIGLTASVLKEDREACVAAGMEDYVTKPIRPADMKAVLDRTVARLERISSGARARFSTPEIHPSTEFMN